MIALSTGAAGAAVRTYARRRGVRSIVAAARKELIGVSWNFVSLLFCYEFLIILCAKPMFNSFCQFLESTFTLSIIILWLVKCFNPEKFQDSAPCACETSLWDKWILNGNPTFLAPTPRGRQGSENVDVAGLLCLCRLKVRKLEI